MLWSLPSMVGRGTKHPRLGNILTRDQTTYLLVFLSFVSHCTLVCVNSARVTVAILTLEAQMLICPTERVIGVKGL